MTSHDNAGDGPAPAASPSGDPWLLTPGPLTTSLEVKQAMLRDFGSRDLDFIAINRRVRERLVAIAGGGDLVCVPLQGSGTFVVEAMIGNFVPADGKLLILINGAYGHRIAKIAGYYGLETEVFETPEDVPIAPASLERLLGKLAAGARPETKPTDVRILRADNLRIAPPPSN